MANSNLSESFSMSVLTCLFSNKPVILSSMSFPSKTEDTQSFWEIHLCNFVPL